MEALPNDYFARSKIVFEYRDSGNYNDLIMLMLNDLMGISNLKTILTLDLSYNKLTVLPESLFECSSLTVLKINSNKITAVPDTFES
jgi:Leucine-rich repeat (LRR) protein